MALEDRRARTTVTLVVLVAVAAALFLATLARFGALLGH